jgi:hypothetical protein
VLVKQRSAPDRSGCFVLKRAAKSSNLLSLFQPEIAAEAIVYASRSRRREVWVGRSSVQAIVANKLFPTLLDHYLAKAGYHKQLTLEQVARGRR